MASSIRISIDAMGGDYGPSVTLGGANMTLERYPNTHFLLFGDSDAINSVLTHQKYSALRSSSEVIHCDVSIEMNEKPSQALRRGRRDSGMWRAVDSVRTGDSDVAISAGNTGALMAMSKVCLKMMSGVERPALAASWPNLRGESIVLDVGATVGADSNQLVEFALMGCALSRALYDIECPKVGLLNVGVEEMKGLEEVKIAGSRLRELSLPNMNYVGFVEGDDIGVGEVDVIVTEGFSGNIALKTAEGTARQISVYLRSAMTRAFISRLGAFLASDAFRHLRAKMDPRSMNGALFLGVNGVVVKSHGGTDSVGFSSAIDVGHNSVRNRLLEGIASDLNAVHSRELD